MADAQSSENKCGSELRSGLKRLLNFESANDPKLRNGVSLGYIEFLCGWTKNCTTATTPKPQNHSNKENR
eukprot:5787092-Amphidinium_carterae.1